MKIWKIFLVIFGLFYLSSCSEHSFDLEESSINTVDPSVEETNFGFKNGEVDFNQFRIDVEKELDKHKFNKGLEDLGLDERAIKWDAIYNYEHIPWLIPIGDDESSEVVALLYARKKKNGKPKISIVQTSNLLHYVQYVSSKKVSFEAYFSIAYLNYYNSKIYDKVDISLIDWVIDNRKEYGSKSNKNMCDRYEVCTPIIDDYYFDPDCTGDADGYLEPSACFHYSIGQDCQVHYDCDNSTSGSTDIYSGINFGGGSPATCTTCADYDLLPYSDNMTSSEMLTNLQSKYNLNNSQKSYLSGNSHLIETIYLGHNNFDNELERAQGLYNVLSHPLSLDEYIQMQVEYAYLKKKYPTWKSWQIVVHAYLNVKMDDIHTGLDIAGLFPVIGEPADLINGALYLFEGDKTNATLSFAASIPVLGWVSTSTKMVMKATVNKKTGGKAYLFMREQNGIIIFSKGSIEGASKQFRDILGTGLNEHAHHVIAKEVRQFPFVQKAARSGKFHLNAALNGFNIPISLHRTGHSVYNQKLKDALFEMNRRYGHESYDQIFDRLNILIEETKMQLKNVNSMAEVDFDID